MALMGVAGLLNHLWPFLQIEKYFNNDVVKSHMINNTDTWLTEA